MFMHVPADAPLAGEKEEDPPMKAMVLERFGDRLVPMDLEIPRPGPGEALVRVKACGLCGTDLKVAAGMIPTVGLPHIPGHEVAGEVVEVGCETGTSEVAVARPGSRVIAYVYVSCGSCEHCLSGHPNTCTGEIRRVGLELPGGLAEYIKVPIANLFAFPDSLSFESACVLSDAVIVALHAIRDRARIQPWEDVAVVGVGGIGIHAVQICARLGARAIAIDRRTECLSAAEGLGAAGSVNAEAPDVVAEVGSICGGGGVDAVIDTVGTSESVSLSLRLLRRGGRAVIIGYSTVNPASVDTYRMHVNELTLLGTRHGTKQNLMESIRMAARGDLTVVVGKTLPLEAANEGLEELRQNRVVGRIVVIP